MREIKKVQSLLKARGFDLGTSGPNGDGVDGVAGKRTWEAILSILSATDATTGPSAAPASGGLEPSAACFELIHSFESCGKRLSDGRFEAYPDPGSRDGHPWTIGWGSTGSDIKRGAIWTQAQCDERFRQDMGTFASGVRNALDGSATTQSQFDALVSFAYNVGLGALRKSTLLKRHRAGEYDRAATEFGRWTKNDGRVMRGLVRRRAAEAELYRGSS